MEKKSFLSRKSAGEYLAAVAALMELVTLVYYCSYANSMGAVDGKVVIFIILAVISNLVYFFVDVESVLDIGIVEIAASVFTTFAIAYFFLNSWSNLADLLNGIQIFSGGKGSLSSIIAILVLLLIADVAEIIACFMKKNK